MRETHSGRSHAGGLHGTGLKPMLAVDIFCLFDGKVVKPWVVRQEGVPTELTKGGNLVFIAI